MKFLHPFLSFCFLLAFQPKNFPSKNSGHFRSIPKSPSMTRLKSSRNSHQHERSRPAQEKLSLQSIIFMWNGRKTFWSSKKEEKYETIQTLMKNVQWKRPLKKLMIFPYSFSTQGIFRLFRVFRRAIETRVNSHSTSSGIASVGETEKWSMRENEFKFVSTKQEKIPNILMVTHLWTFWPDWTQKFSMFLVFLFDA